MKEADLINKLAILKRFEPRDSTMSSVKRRVFHETGAGKHRQDQGLTAIISRLFTPGYGLALALVIVLFVGFVLRPVNPMTQMAETMHVAVLSLSAAGDQKQVISQEQNMDRAHAQLARLNLNGEPGKYTKEQCRQMYDSYETYLKEYKQRLTGVMDGSGQSDTAAKGLYQKITQYQQEAEMKW